SSIDPWPAESTKRSRSGQLGFAGSNFRNFEKRTVATSAIPIGMPGWPELAACTASMESARIAFAMSLCWVGFDDGLGPFVFIPELRHPPVLSDMTVAARATKG